MIARLRFVFLFAGLLALGYVAWIYADGAWKQRQEERAFDEARAAAENAPAPPVVGRTPSKPRPAAPLSTLHCRLSIPRLHIRTVVDEGVGDDVLRYAAGHIPSTALPGQAGNVALAAHRDTIFRDLRLIHPGDKIVLETVQHDYQYVVDNMAIVEPANVGILKSTPGEQTLTLVTCYPFNYIGSAPKRFIVQAHRVSGSLQPLPQQRTGKPRLRRISRS